MKLIIPRNRLLTFVVYCVFAMSPVGALQASPYAMAAPGGQNPPAAPEQPSAAHLTPQQLQELVAPIALYPDALVAQILAASAYPTQIVEADRFLQDNPNLKGADLGAEVDKQDWDPSVKALTQFPSVLSNMDKDLSWTSELGDANYNQPQDVMDAIQYMRHQAQQAGHLQSTPQQTVTNDGNAVVIQPASPEVVYVPEYDPALVYGYPVPFWPGFYPWWDVSGPFISFGIGFGIGPFFGFGWGWPAWGWHWGYGGGPWFHGGRYAFHSHAFYDRNAYFHGNYRGSAPFARGDRGMRGYAPREGERGGERANPSPTFRGRSAPRSSGRTGAFGGITHGGDSRSFSSRGAFSMGGGGFHGGGGMRGGGGRR
jgi:uncharacterized membrane protein YgcG